MRKEKIIIPVAAVIAMLFVSCMAIIPSPAEEGTEILGASEDIVSTPSELIAAVAAGKGMILLANDIEVTGNTIMTVGQAMDITIQSQGASNYTILMKDNTKLVVEGKLTLKNINFIQDAGHRATTGLGTAWFTLSSNPGYIAELKIVGCVIESQVTYGSSMGLITRISGDANVYVENSTLISSQRAINGQTIAGMVCYLKDAAVIAPTDAIYGGDYILEGSTAINGTVNLLNANIYDFRGITITGPTVPGNTVVFAKTGTGVNVNNPQCRIYYNFVPDFAPGMGWEYSNPLAIGTDTTFYVALSLTMNGKTYFGTPVRFDCIYAPSAYELLTMAYMDAMDISPRPYTDESYAGLTQALDDAVKVMQNMASTDGDYLDARDAILDAVANLRPHVGVSVGTEAELIAAIAAGHPSILLIDDIYLTGDTVLTIDPSMDITIRSAGIFQYSIACTERSRIVAEGNLSLINMCLIQMGDHEYYDGNIAAHAANPWFAVCGDAEICMKGALIMTLRTYNGPMGLITITGGTPTLCLDTTMLVSNKRAVFGQEGMVCYMNNVTVSSNTEALCGPGDFILRGTTTYSTHTPNARIYNFTGATIVYPTGPAEYAVFEKTTGGISGFNPAYKIYYSYTPEFTLLTAIEYTGPIPLSSDTVLYAALGFTQNGRTYFGNPIKATFAYESATGTNSYEVTLPSGIGYSAAPYGGSVSPVEFGGQFSFTVALEPGYDRSAPIVRANGAEIYAIGGIYTVDVTENIDITVEGVELNVYEVSLISGAGYVLNGASAAGHGTLYVFTLKLEFGYDMSDPVVWANGMIVPDAGGLYMVFVTEDLIISAGNIQLNIYSVTLSSGAGFMLSGAPDALHGDAYLFTVTLAGGYDASSLVVKANGVQINAVGGFYMVNEVEDDIFIAVDVNHNGNGNGNSGNNGNGNNGNGNGNTTTPGNNGNGNGNGGTNNGGTNNGNGNVKL